MPDKDVRQLCVASGTRQLHVGMSPGAANCARHSAPGCDLDLQSRSQLHNVPEDSYSLFVRPVHPLGDADRSCTVRNRLGELGRVGGAQLNQQLVDAPAMKAFLQRAGGPSALYRL